MAPIAIAIITFGYHTQQGKQLLRLMDEQSDRFYPPVDVRHEWMRNEERSVAYAQSVSHYENADSERTQTAILNDPRYYAACLSLVSHLEYLMSQEALPQVQNHM